MIVKPTVQFIMSEKNQVASRIDEKLSFGYIVFLGEEIEKHRPQNVSRSDRL